MIWPDLVIGGIALLGAYKGFRTGFINELSGMIALAAAIWAGFLYPGMWDAGIRHAWHLGPGSSHVLGLLGFAALIYALATAAGFLLGFIAHLPLIRSGNSLLGGAVGLTKALVFLWAILYVTLFFPLPHDLRHDLHASSLVSLIAAPNPGLDNKFRDAIPPFAKILTAPMFMRHTL